MGKKKLNFDRPKIIPGLVVLFGSGEQTSVARKIYEEVFVRLGKAAPLHIGILETPTGFEVNAIHGWPERQKEFFEKHLSNYRPDVTRIRAWRRNGPHSTQDTSLVDPLLDMDFVYSGAGSPSYVVKHLRGTRAWRNLIKAHKNGTVLCFGSATAVASGAWALPVYEIFKVGEDLHWLNGLDFFNIYKLKLAVIPHWNNREGEDFDSTRCWMGKERFAHLVTLLPTAVTVLGIDETTAVLFDFQKRELTVLGTGDAHIIRRSKATTLVNGKTYPITILGIATRKFYADRGSKLL